MKREVPFIITLVVGIAFIVQYFVPHPPFDAFEDTFNNWFCDRWCIRDLARRLEPVQDGDAQGCTQTTRLADVACNYRLLSDDGGGRIYRWIHRTYNSPPTAPSAIPGLILTGLHVYLHAIIFDHVRDSGVLCGFGLLSRLPRPQYSGNTVCCWQGSL